MTTDARRRTPTVVCLVLAMLSTPGWSQTWTPLTNAVPGGGQAYRMRLLTDGTVMAQNGSSADWLRLTPDGTGSYVNGTWSTTSIAPMNTRRFSFPSEVLQNGDVWIFGGENYGPSGDAVWTATGEKWNSTTNKWSPVAIFPPQACFGVTYNVTGKTFARSEVIQDLPAPVTPTFLAGWTVSGPGIPAGATITSVESNTKIQMSVAATATQTGAALQFSGTPTSCFGDVPTILLPGGKILAGSLVDNATYLYTIASNSWAFAANKVYQDSSDEEGWTLLADGRVINYDIGPSIDTGNSIAELYDPTANAWSSISPSDGSATGTFPLLSSVESDYELGPSLRLEDGRAFLIGATGHTALYSSSTNSWAAGPDIIGSINGTPAPFGADDAPAALLPNGHVILSADAGPAQVESSGSASTGSNIITNIPSTAGLYVGWPVLQTSGTPVVPSGSTITSLDSPTQIHISQSASGTAAGIGLQFGGAYSPPTQLFDFNPRANTISPVSPALSDPFLNTNAYNTSMLMLPTGQLLFADGSYQLWIYTPEGTASPAYQPVISTVTYEGSGVFTLTGKRLTGPSAGAAYGDDAEMDENYPIVRLVGSTGATYYCRTTDWSHVGVGPGASSVQFTLNPSVTADSYMIIVSAAGISSIPSDITITQAEVAGQ